MLVSPSGSWLYSTVFNAGLPLQSMGGNCQAANRGKNRFISRVRKSQMEIQKRQGAKGAPAARPFPGVSNRGAFSGPLLWLSSASGAAWQPHERLRLQVLYVDGLQRAQIWMRDCLYRCSLCSSPSMDPPFWHIRLKP